MDFVLEDTEEIVKEEIFDYNFMNMRQIKAYMEEFQQSFGKLDAEEYEFFLDQINLYTEKYENHKKFGLSLLSPEDFFSFLAQTNRLMLSMKNKFREIWTEFNLKLMFLGCFIMIASIATILFFMEFLERNIQTNARFLDSLFTIREICKISKISIYFLIFFLMVSWVYEIEILEILAFFSFLLSLNFLFYVMKVARTIKQELMIKDKQAIGRREELFGHAVFWVLQISHGYMLFAVSHIRNEGNAILFMLILVNCAYILFVSTKSAELKQKAQIIKNIVVLTLIQICISFYESHSLNRNDITLKKVNSSKLTHFHLF